jgi:hypothetical protein
MTSEVKAHKDVLAAIDTRLVPSVKNGELKGIVTEMRRQVADHLARAQDIQRKLDSAAQAGPPGASKREGRVGLGLGIPEPKEPMPAQPAGKHDRAAKAAAKAESGNDRKDGKRPPPDRQR